MEPYSSSNISLKKILIMLLGFLTPWIIIFYFGSHVFAYGVYVNDSCVGYVKHKAYMKDALKDIEKDLGNRYNLADIDKILKYNISFVKEEYFNSTEDLKNNIKNSLDNDIQILTMKSDNVELATVVNEKEGEELLEKLKNSYIESNNISKDNLKEASLKSNITYESKNIKLKDLGSLNDTYNKVKGTLEESKYKNLKFKIDIIKEEKTKIGIPSVIKASNDMYIGESKVIQEGAEGEKLVRKEITFINEEKIGEKVIEEKVIKEPEQKIVENGSKNPINEEVAFLAPPSRGINNVTSNFGYRWGKQHNGVDIAGNTGDPIFAALDGTVTFSGWQDGYGKVLKINHGDNIETIYAHCSALDKKVGEKVSKGDVIAKVGSTGRSTGPHLHFELRVKGEPKNPLNYINK
ncbi:peptidoglycan DD-metalloendopeptidase family protein [Clostridium hydrogeniformans]|uniref:peptidoglycan DD-metalloendopeptidase family protein n=1 Tax=Clostridium hydrogeniformans TaxID=349933 RepID=UPI0006925D49|nr:M23 family metallopeptidase [Clostridium hydrogeniformans]